MISPIRWQGDRLLLLDQTLLPVQEVERPYTAWQEVAEAIRTLVVRGAPAIGVTAAFGVVLAARASAAREFDGLMADLEEAVKGLLQQTDLRPGDFAKAIFQSADARGHLALAKKL